MLGLIKAGPLFLLVLLKSSLVLWGALNLLFSLPILYSASSPSLIYLGSGLLSFLLLSLLPVFLSPFYLLAYNLSLLICCCYKSLLLSPLFTHLSLGGFPPSPLFFIKVLLLLYLPGIYSIIVLFLTAFSLCPYFSLRLILRQSFTSSFTMFVCVVVLWLLLLLLVLPIL